MRTTSLSTLDSATNALRLLKLLGARRVVTAAEVSHELGVGKSTAHRLLMTLLSQDFATRDPGGRRYYAGQAAVSAGLSSVWDFDVRQCTSKPLAQLAASIGQTVVFQVLDGPFGRVLDVGTTSSSLPLGTVLGELVPANATAAGKVLISRYTEDMLRVRLGRRLPQLTDSTIIDWDSLMVELQAVRKRGWATSQSESTVGVNGVAVPVFDRPDKIVGAISVAGPDSYMTRSVLMETLGHLVPAAQYISRMMAA